MDLYPPFENVDDLLPRVSDEIAELRERSGAISMAASFVIYISHGPFTAEGYAAARAFGLRRSDEIDAAIARFPDRILPARNGADAARIRAAGKLVAFKSIENSHPLGEDLSLLAPRRIRVPVKCSIIRATSTMRASANSRPRAARSA